MLKRALHLFSSHLSAFLQAPTAEMNTEESVHTLPGGLDLYAKTWKVCLNLRDAALIPIRIS